MSISNVSVISPLLDDSRLTMPEMKVSSNLGMAATGLRAAFHGAGGGVRGVANAAGQGIGATGRAAKEVLGQGVRGIADSAKELAKGTMAGGKSMVSSAIGGVAGPAAPTATAPIAPVSTNPPAAPGSLSHVLQNLSMPKAMGYGALAGAAKGLIDPGTYTDENGNVQQKSRVGAVLGSAATGAALGGVSAPLIRGGARMHASMPVAPAEGVAKNTEKPAGGMFSNATTLPDVVPSSANAPIVSAPKRTKNSPNPLDDVNLNHGIQQTIPGLTHTPDPKLGSLLPIVGPALKSASAPGNLDATTNPMIAGVPAKSGDSGDSGGQISMDASTAKISAKTDKTDKNPLDASLSPLIETKKEKPGSKPFNLPSLNLSKKK